MDAGIKAYDTPFGGTVYVKWDEAGNPLGWSLGFERMDAQWDTADIAGILDRIERGIWTLAECDCDEEYGPCERHGVTVCQREGASLRTADELALVYCDDAASLLASDPYGYLRENLSQRLEDCRSTVSGTAWFEDPDDAEAAQDLVQQYESLVGDAGYLTYWDDGYRIVKPTDDCPLTQ